MRKVTFATVVMLPWLSVAAADLPEGWYPIGDQDAERYELDVDAEHGYSGRGSPEDVLVGTDLSQHAQQRDPS